MNIVILEGRITRDLVLKEYDNNKYVCDFTLAVHYYSKISRKEETSFIDCVVWNNQAKNLVKYCQKGSLISVNGKLVSRSYINKSGIKIYTTEVVVDILNYLSKKAN